MAFIETRALIRALETRSAATELKRATTTAKNVPITPRAAIVNWWALKNSSGFKRQSCLACLSRVALTIAHHFDRLLVPIELRPHISATMAAGATDEPRLNVGQPGIVRPVVAVDRNRMAAVMVRAIDQQAAHTLGTHVGKADFVRAGR